MSEEEQESLSVSVIIFQLLLNTPLIGIILFMLLALRPEEGYMRVLQRETHSIGIQTNQEI